MIQDITYESPFLYFEAPQSGTAVDVLAYSYDGDNFDASTTGAGETSVVFIH
tara:strand:+ start:787 stop:942 length:156 start_codon:yes stop_codon:yes gene_type:complete